MPRNHFARLSIILLVAAFLAVPQAWGAPNRLAAGVNPFDILARMWDSLSAVWAEEGCHADPHGGCGAALHEVPAPPPTMDEGCHLDPHGRCMPGS